MRLLRLFVPHSIRIMFLLSCVVVIGSLYLVAKKIHDTSFREIPICHGCNVIVIAIDPVRRDAIHALGNPREVTPVIDALAKNGFLFTNAYTTSSWTLPSAMSLFTSTAPSVHKVTNKFLIGASEQEGLFPADIRKTNPGLSTLAEVMKSNGYVTGGFAGGAALDASYGFDKGFDQYESQGDFNGLSSVIPKALGFMSSHTTDHMFILLHGFDTHGQYIPQGALTRKYVDTHYTGPLIGSKEEQRALREEGVLQESIHLTQTDTQFLRAIYDEKVEHADQEVGEFLQAVKKMKLRNKTIIVFTSDHGDEFYEHGRIDHGMTLYDEVIHVPLIVVLPDQSSGRVIDSQVRNIDIMPTIFALTGVSIADPVRGQMEGVSLVPSMQGKRQYLDVYTETEYRYAIFLRAIQTWDGWKFITDQENVLNKHLYNIHDDPNETSDLIGSNVSKELELQSKLTKYISK